MLGLRKMLCFILLVWIFPDLGEIGRGAYGTVNKMLHKKSSTAIAVKVRYNAG